MAIAEALVEGGHAELSDETGIITESGSAVLSKLNIDVKVLTAPTAKPATKVFCSPCLDWSERRPHLAGKIGAAICAKVSRTTGSSVSKAAAPSPLRQRDDSCFATRLVYRISDDHTGS